MSRVEYRHLVFIFVPELAEALHTTLGSSVGNGYVPHYFTDWGVGKIPDHIPQY